MYSFSILLHIASFTRVWTPSGIIRLVFELCCVYVCVICVLCVYFCVTVWTRVEICVHMCVERECIICVVCVCVFMWLCAHIYAGKYAYTCVCVRGSVLYVCLCVYLCGCVHICVQVFIYMCMPMSAHVHVEARDQCLVSFLKCSLIFSFWNIIFHQIRSWFIPLGWFL